MTKVSTASSTQNLGALHPKTVIDPGDDILFATGRKKLGQPVPESNFESDEKSGRPQQTQW